MAQSIKVLHINTWGTGGAGVACKRVSKSINAAGVNSKVLFLKNQVTTDEWHSFAEKENSLSFFIKKQILRALSFLPTVGKKAIYNNSLYSPYNITKHPLFKEADIIHIHWVSKFMHWESVIANSGKPIVLTMHDMYPFTGFHHYEMGLDKKQYARIIKQRKNKLSHIYHNKVIATAPSERMAELGNESQVFQNKVLCVPNCIDTEVFKPLTRNADEIFKILFVAENLAEERKGFSILIEALKKLPEDLNYELQILGKGTFDIPHSKLLGFITNPAELVQIYNEADVFVISTLEDNLPNTVLESLSCGTPVLGFNVGGIPDMVRHQENGFLAKNQSPEGLIEGLQWLREHRLSPAKVSSIIQEKFSETRCAERYISIYNALLNPA